MQTPIKKKQKLRGGKNLCMQIAVMGFSGLSLKIKVKYKIIILITYNLK